MTKRRTGSPGDEAMENGWGSRNPGTASFRTAHWPGTYRSRRRPTGSSSIVVVVERWSTDTTRYPMPGAAARPKTRHT